MSKPEAARYRTTNWKSYNEALKRRGSLLIWLDKDMAWLAAKAGRPGRPPVFSDAAIQFCLMVKVLFGLPLQQTTGMVSSILEMAKLAWPVPDFSTLSRRQKSISVEISSRRAPGPLNLLVDSTGIKFLGDGEWLARKHGTHRRRQYRKVHLAMATATGDIGAVEFTSSREGDSPILPDLLDQIPPDQPIGTVTGDGAFDTRRCHAAILDRGGNAIIPIRKNGRLWKEDCPAARAMTFCAPHGTLGARSGRTGRAIMFEVGSRRRCAASSPSERGSHHEIPTARPQKSTSASPS